MRVRMIRPSYWTDADLHTRLTAEQREFYIGLWMEADDQGYVDWDPIRIGAELYPFRSLAWRRAKLPLWVEALGAHVRLLDCGRHLVVPNLTKHQNVPRPTDTNRRAHERTCVQMRAGARIAPQVLEGKGREGKGREEGTAADDGARGALVAALAQRGLEVKV